MNAHLDEALLAELARAKGDQLRSAVRDRMRVQQSARVDALIGQLFDIARELRQLNQDFTASRLPRPGMPRPAPATAATGQQNKERAGFDKPPSPAASSVR